MKVIIAGSRDILDRNSVFECIEEGIKELGIEVTAVVCGEARGIDTLGKRWAESNGIEVISFPANWRKYKRSAGYVRNAKMAKCSDALIAITNGSSGTAHMIALAEKEELKMFVKLYTKQEDDIDFLIGESSKDIEEKKNKEFVKLF